MSNTLANKARLLGAYFGVKCLKMTGKERKEPLPIIVPWCAALAEAYLQLKDLKNISDEDAWGVGIRVNCWSKKERKMDFFLDDELKETHINFGRMFATSIGKEYGPGLSHPFSDNNSTDILDAYDFLRSRRYAMQFNGWTVEDQVKWGWVQIETP